MTVAASQLVKSVPTGPLPAQSVPPPPKPNPAEDSLRKIYDFAKDLFLKQIPFQEGQLPGGTAMLGFTRKDSASVYIDCPEQDVKSNDTTNSKVDHKTPATETEEKVAKQGSTKIFNKAMRWHFTLGPQHRWFDIPTKKSGDHDLTRWREAKEWDIQEIDVNIVGCLKLRPGLEGKEREEALARMQKEINLLQMVYGKAHLCQLYDGVVYERKVNGDAKKTEKVAVEYQHLYTDDIGEMVELHQLCQQPHLNDFIEQMLEALVELENLGIVHLDLKFKNIFHLNHAFFLSDFDLGALVRNVSSDATGTPAFLSPELFTRWCGEKFVLEGKNPGTISRQDAYDARTDVWSFGTMLEHLTAPNMEPPRLTQLLDQYNANFTISINMTNYGAASDEEKRAFEEAESELPKIVEKYKAELNRLHNEMEPADPLQFLIWKMRRPLQKDRWKASEALKFFNEKIKTIKPAIVKVVPQTPPLKRTHSYQSQTLRRTLNNPILYGTLRRENNLSGIKQQLAKQPPASAQPTSYQVVRERSTSTVRVHVKDIDFSS